MLVHQIFALPSADTVDYLKNMFDGCPFEVDFDGLCVELNSSFQEMEEVQGNVCAARAGSMNLFYDSNTQQSSLLLPLISDQLALRAFELRETAPSAFYGNLYYPYLIFKRGMVNPRRHIRAFINSVSDTLVSANAENLYFEYEVSLSRDLMYAPDMDYYQSRMASQI
jgi:hypothetical protein